MSKPKMVNATVGQLDCRSWKGIEINWSPARAAEVRIQKSTVRNRLLKALGTWMSTAALMCGVTGCTGGGKKT
jgi:hypothetical protein